jgi:Ca2+-binding RTX toxin-like protein
MTVSPGNLNGLLNVVVPSADYGGVSFQSVSSSSVTGTTTGVPGAGTTSQETITISAVNNQQNTVTFSLSVLGQAVGQQTFYVLGYAPNSVLLSGSNAMSFFSPVFANDYALLNDDSGVLSTAPIAAGSALSFTTTGSSSVAPGGTPTPTPVPSPTVIVTDTSTHQAVSVTPQAYSGPVAGLQEQYINVSADSLNITTGSPSWFIHSGTGTDAIDVSAGGGNNVLDGSTGSNFLVGGLGNDTFFVDDRSAATDIWDTVTNFHVGDSATVWGVTPQDFGIAWADGQGAAGYTGLTLHATGPGKPNAALTLAAYTTGDLSSGRLTVTYGTDPGSGSPYMLIQAH